MGDRSDPGHGDRIKLPFERPPTGVLNPNTSYPDVSVTHSHGLAVPRSEPDPKEIGKHTNSEPMIEQSCSSAAFLSCCGKQFECTSLARVELTSSMQSTHRIALRRDPASTRRMIPFSRVVQGRTVILRSLGKLPPRAPRRMISSSVDKPTDNKAPLVLCHRD
jgi:hypothetical protein